MVNTWGARKKLYKIIIIGDSSVGKTSILHTYIKGSFSNQYKATIGADFYTKNIEIDDEEIILQVWDTAGQERFQSLGMAFYRGADACLLVYDVTNYASFKNIDTWKNNFINNISIDDVNKFPIILVGNKSDLPRKISKAEVKSWSNRNNIDNYITSAKEKYNIQRIFIEITKKMIEYKSNNDDKIYYPTEAVCMEEDETYKSKETKCCIIS